MASEDVLTQSLDEAVSVHETLQKWQQEIIDEIGKEKDEIVTEYQKGYMYADKVLRPAMVVVASGNFVKKDKSVEEDKPETGGEKPEINNEKKEK